MTDTDPTEQAAIVLAEQFLGPWAELDDDEREPAFRYARALAAAGLLAAPAAQPDDEAALTGAELIAAERQRQIEAEGYDAAHDEGHLPVAFVEAAISYATQPFRRREVDGAPYTWPWRTEDWKPCPDDRARELVKAGALLAAAIDAMHARAALAALRGKQQ